MLEAATEKLAHLWQRDEHDWYVEPIRATVSLLAAESFEGGVWDPACGGGNIVRSMIAAGIPAVGTDLVDRAGSPAWFAGTWDFILGRAVGDRFVLDDRYVSNIVSNPPFYRAKGTEKYIRSALQVARHKVCIFASIKFLAGQARASGLWLDHPPSRVWILSERPSCPPGAWLAAGNSAQGGTDDWSWYVWDKADESGETRLGWLRKAVL